MKNNDDGMTVWRCDRWQVMSDEWQSNEVMECLEMAEMAETLEEGLGGMEWDLDEI